ncbi:NifU family protein [Streptomyces sp. RKND-216]|uniref:NifU family protein n=1 Tax=Streptomyces sp. RKND-216 TaxID=2562581 RepID=UPI00109DB8BE|nr:NifU family protein [Streptomyces sp. RKND-216]THA24008.1 NifU family protein [Streptomyces sp. RKND-216]
MGDACCGGGAASGTAPPAGTTGAPPTVPPAVPVGRLDDAAVGERLARADDLLGRVEGVAGPTTEAAVEAVQTLAEIYGEALARVLDLAGEELRARMGADELLAHLMVLHELHPEPVEARVAAALERVRPGVQEHGGDVELVGVDGTVATVRLLAKGCGTSAGTLEDAVREAVLGVAPELTEVRRAPAEGGSGQAFVPLDTLTVARPPSVSAGERT